MKIFRRNRGSDDDAVEDTLGEVIRNERLRQGLERQDVARMAGVTEIAVEEAERNDFTAYSIRAILTALKIEYIGGSPEN